MISKLDLPETTLEHGRIIRSKKILKLIYQDFYQLINKRLENIPPGDIIELGSGAGFIKEVIAQVKTSDIMPLATVDMTFSAEKMPFKNSSIAAFVMLNVFHHIKNINQALIEMQRVLKPKGKIIMIEPYNSPFARFIYTFLHHEPFLPKADWQIKEGGNLSGANDALAWIVFYRDRKLFQAKYPKLKITYLLPHTAFLYLLSGGLSKPQRVPIFLVGLIKKIESISFIRKYFSMFVTIELTKQ